MKQQKNQDKKENDLYPNLIMWAISTIILSIGARTESVGLIVCGIIGIIVMTIEILK